jgi:hypothetical protein
MWMVSFDPLFGRHYSGQARIDHSFAERMRRTARTRERLGFGRRAYGPIAESGGSDRTFLA